MSAEPGPSIAPAGGPMLTGGRLLARNTIINLASEAAPFLVGLFAIPVLVQGLGVDRYGVLTLSMIVVGYFGLFDFGLGRAATKYIAEAAASDDHSNIPGLFWTSLYMMLAFGTAGAILVAALTPWLVLDILKITPAFRPESLHAFYLLAFAMPIVISGGSLGGTLSAYQRFDLINLVRVPSGIFAYIGPLIMLPFSHSIAWMVAVMVVGRLASWSVSIALCLRVIPALRHNMRPSRATVRSMLRFGGWVTVSGLISPIMSYFDRFLIGAMLSVAAISYYTVPFQITGKLGIVPGAMGGVAFAAFAGSFTKDPARAMLIFERVTRYTLLALFAPVLILVAFAPEILTLWLGAGFAAHSASVLRLLAVATFVNCLAWPPYSLIQAAHRPDLTAAFHVAEAPFYIAFLWWILPRYGIEGAAIAWLVRVSLDMIMLFAAAWRLMPRASAVIIRIAEFTCAALLIFGLCAIPTTLTAKTSCVAGVLVLFASVCWTMLLEPQEKNLAREYLRSSRHYAIGEAQ
ncbi:MAG: flippase [Candidatus Binataceae bacterium]|nr:flippase [Candidatus Binataceae bacterium]